jgi:hypothetical protein
MCSVTFWPARGGYRLAMNRDELRTRVAGRPAATFSLGALTATHPHEPAGGTWISLNSGRVAYALVNWYAAPPTAGERAGSRGDVVLALRACLTPDEAHGRLAGLPLARLKPFRVAGVFPDSRTVSEWRWDGTSLQSLPGAWTPRQWLSSGHDEGAAQRARGAEFLARRSEAGAGGWPWLRRLHASHTAGSPALSTCMHRPDATTVSYTEVEATTPVATLRHWPGSPCGLAWPAALSP